MKTPADHNYYTYILTNQNKTVLYVGVTNDLQTRLSQHRLKKKTFTYRYNCFHLVYYEQYSKVEYAISREKEIKRWRRKRKEELINKTNPNWDFLEEEWE